MRVVSTAGQIPLPLIDRLYGGVAVVMPAAPLFLCLLQRTKKPERDHRVPAFCHGCVFRTQSPLQDAAALGRLLELRWKNSAWLATADTMAGWKGFEIKNAGSGRSPVRKRSG